MKIFVLVVFLFLSLFASNMSLGPYNKKNYTTAKELKENRLKEIQKRKKELEIQLKRFHKRQAELKQKRLEEKLKRREARRIQEELKEKKRLEKIRIQEEKARLEKEEKLRLKREYEALREQKEKELLNKKNIKPPKEQIDDNNNTQSNDYNLSLTPEQADISINNPDDIETELSNINRLRYLLLHSPGTPEYIKDYIRLLNELEEKYNIDLAFSYRSIIQAENESSNVSGGGKYDFTLRYRATESTQFALKLEASHKAGKYTSNEIRQSAGSLTSTSASYKSEDPYLSQLWMQQKIQNFHIRAGKIDSSSFIDSHLFKSNSRFFFNGTFSTSPYNSYPQDGIGIAMQYIKPRYYISTEITDANAIKDEIDDTFFSKKEYYTAIEFGITPEDGSKYHITAWHIDDSNITQKPEAKGMIASFVQTLDADTHLIIRAAYSDNAIAKRYASIGLGRMSLFKEHDISGIAIGTLVPSDETKRTQTSIESFYRVDPLPGIQLSADLQFIYHPSDNTENWVILPGVRLRILF